MGNLHEGHLSLLKKSQKNAGYEMVISPHIGNKKLYEICDHKWIRDTSCSDDDLGKNYCEHCGLRYYYNYKRY